MRIRIEKMALLIALVCLAFPKNMKAQVENAQAYTIKPIWIEARVLGILEHHDRLAVIQVSKVDSSNKFMLRVNSEILAEFVFGTKASKGEPAVPGANAGDTIRAEIHGEFNPSTGQWDYRVFRYTRAKSSPEKK